MTVVVVMVAVVAVVMVMVVSVRLASVLVGEVSLALVAAGAWGRQAWAWVGGCAAGLLWLLRSAKLVRSPGCS